MRPKLTRGTEQVKFERQTHFTGRNGYGKCNGIDLLPLDHNKSLMIAPLTSRGDVGRCDIEVPMENLPELIAKLQEIYQATLPAMMGFDKA